MAHQDWFRNSAWSDEIEGVFFSRLARTRKKSQYLRIQASTLASAHPRVALRLLDQYFALGDHFDHAQAHVDRANAYLALRDVNSAILSFDAALAREAAYPRVLTQAYLDLPVLIAVERRKEHYQRSLQILTAHKAHPTFPIDHYRWHGAHALILQGEGRMPEAREAARRALEAAKMQHSGFRDHPNLGLVGDTTDELGQRLRRIAGVLD